MATRPLPNPASPRTKLASMMTAAPASHSPLTRRSARRVLSRPHDAASTKNDADAPDHGDRLERIPVEHDEIGELAGLDHADAGPFAQHVGRHARRGYQSLPRRQSRVDQELELAMK